MKTNENRSLIWANQLMIWGTLLLTTPCFAESYGNDDVGSALGRVIGWVTKGIGAAMVVIGMIIVGVRMSMHDDHALSKGGYVIAGGLIIFMAETILGIIKKLAGYAG